VMEDLMKGPQLDDAKILPAVDRIAQARGELEKADARLLLALRHLLTPEQWQKLNAETPQPHHPGPPPPRPGPPPPVREE
jgi:Spy/CpxP family protein refolding chaperone